jgi:glycosyltransferase involved in cell wall biosynthesis
MIGAHRTKTLGGITTLIETLLQSSLTNEFTIRHLATQADEYSALGKLLLAATAWLKFIFQIFWWKPSIVYIHVGANLSSYRKLPFLLAARLLRRKIVTHFHAGDFAEYYAQQPRFGQWLLRLGLRQSDRLLAVSESLRVVLAQLLPQKAIDVIPNGIALDDFAAEGRRNQSTARAGEAVVRLLFVGAMGRLKGERDLLQAVHSLSQRYPALRVTLLGHGSEAIEDLIAEKQLAAWIEFIGPVKLHERAQYFRQADFFVLPSYAEGMPISIIEAMAAGLPVIATRIGGIPELVTENREGWLVEAGDATALAERIAFVLDHPAEREQAGLRARQKAQQFDLTQVIRQLEAVFRQMR